MRLPLRTSDGKGICHKQTTADKGEVKGSEESEDLSPKYTFKFQIAVSYR